MKKSLVISTIATVLVVVVALTTATFAWFSASGDTTISSSFTISSAGGGLYVYTWDTAQDDYSADPLISPDGGSAIDLGTYTQPFEWSAANAGQAFATGDATESYRPLMPLYEIGGVYDSEAASGVPQVAGSGESVGLANIPFVYAETAQNNKVTIKSVTARPVTARFQLQAGYASTNAKIEIEINTDENQNRNINTIRNIKYVLIGQAGNATGTVNNQNFVLATNYNAIHGVSSDNIGQAVTPDYTTTQVTFTEASGDTETEVVAVGNPSSYIFGTAYTDSVSFKMTDSQPVDCVLYMWLDGQNVRENAGRGSFTFTLRLSGEDANPAP